MEKRIKTAVWLLVLVLGIFMLFGALVSATRTDEAATLYVEYEGESLADGDSVNVEIGETVRFSVGYKRSFLKTKGVYHVKIIPRITEETEFTFSVGGAEKKYSEIPALTNAFNVIAGDGSFTICAESDLPGILSKVYSTALIDNVPTVENVGVEYFTLVVISENLLETVKIDFRLGGDVYGVELSHEGILF